MVHQLCLLETGFMFPESLLQSYFHVPRAAHVLKHWRVCRHVANLSKLQSSSKLERTCLKALLCMAACQKFGVEDCKLVSLADSRIWDLFLLHLAASDIFMADSSIAVDQIAIHTLSMKARHTPTA